MSTISSAPAAARNSERQSWANGMVAALKRWWVAYATRRAQQVAIDQLWAMSDRDLRDIGLTRSEISGAVKTDAARNLTFSRYY